MSALPARDREAPPGLSLFVGTLVMDGSDATTLRRRLDRFRRERMRALVVTGDLAAGVEVADDLVAFPGAVVAAIGDEVFDAGLATALACDVRVAGASARLCAGPRVDAARFTRVAGETVSRDLLLTGRVIGAAEAFALGLLSAVVADADVVNAAREWALLIASRAPLSVQANKECLLSQVRTPLREAVRYERQGWARLQRTKDHREALAAFFAKRPPQFIGE